MSSFHTLYYLISALLFSLSMYGWGSIVFFKSLPNLISLKIILGMAFTLFLGGIFNYLNYAFYLTIDIIFILGLVLMTFTIQKNFKNFKLTELIKRFNKFYLVLLIPFIFLIIHIIFTIDPTIYNLRDDFQKYFTHPIKMLETGSFYGSSLSSIGRETFGGQAFFQSFFVSWLGLRSINIFDNIFCLALCCFLIIEYSIKLKTLVFGSLIACLVILIHTMYVNVSSIYSSVLFTMMIIIILFELFSENSNLKFNLSITALTLSLCFASLTVLKTSSIIFTIIFFLLFIISLFFLDAYRGLLLKLLLMTPFFSLIIMFPWIIYSINQILTVGTQKSLDTSIDDYQFILPKFFSIEKLFYGATQLHYTALNLIGVLLLFLVFVLKKKNSVLLKENFRGALIVGVNSIISCVIIYFVTLTYFSQSYYELSQLTRYSIPFIIAIIPLSILILFSFLPKAFSAQKLIFYVSIIIITFSFLPQYIERIKQNKKCGSHLSFEASCSERYVNYNKFTLSNNAKIQVQNWQKLIPEKKSIMALITKPFYLDFKRNEILEIELAGFGNPWHIFPSGEYMIWQHSGMGSTSVRSLKKNINTFGIKDAKESMLALQSIQKIDEMFKDKEIEVIKNDQEVLIFKLKKID